VSKFGDEPVSVIFSQRTIACHSREQEDEAGCEAIKKLKLIYVAVTGADVGSCALLEGIPDP
jgi:hypothetical protein